MGIVEIVTLRVDARASSETQGQIVGARQSLNGQKNMTRRTNRAVARKKLQPRRTHGPLYEISRMKSSNIISLIKKIKIDSI